MGEGLAFLRGNWQASSGYAFRGLASLLLPRESPPSPTTLALRVSRNHFRENLSYLGGESGLHAFAIEFPVVKVPIFKR
ncbi:hypothetical protein SAMN04487936_10864 [Halobacillus dabanensis]|uniref:Uncharacterized protein n=1 Tax=Halobacillus dabanensis TaxID=240302 RepID=A0A1I3X8F9_HALDA|nr:hypothetical protein SAMN04487936_10864 [Halobacillus dabanensis]